MSSRCCRRFFVLGLISVLTAPHAPAQTDSQLDPGRTIERQLAARERHSYRIHADAGQVFRLEFDPSGFDLTVTVLSPAGEKIAEAVSFTGEQRLLRLSAPTGVEGDYELQVTRSGVAAGGYRVRLAELTPLYPAGEKRIAAESAFFEGKRLRTQGSRASLDRRGGRP